MSEWYRNDDLWRVFGRCMFLNQRFDDARDEVESLLALAGQPVSRVLDLGCGPGRHAVPLAELGLTVTGVDLSRHLLEQAKDYAGSRAATVNWVHEDMRRFQSPDGFDFIISMWTSFGYFDAPEDDRQVLRQSLHNLSSGGVLLIDIAGKEYMARNIQPVHLTEFEDGALLIERPNLEQDMTRYANEWILIDADQQVHRAQWHHNLYSGQELRTLLADAGFVDIALYGNLAGDDYDLDAERLIAVARKPAAPAGR